MLTVCSCKILVSKHNNHVLSFNGMASVTEVIKVDAGTVAVIIKPSEVDAVITEAAKPAMNL